MNRSDHSDTNITETIAGDELDQSSSLVHPIGQNSFEYLKVLIETYRHHFDLFVKGWLLYFAVIGALAGYVSKEGPGSSLQRAVAILIGVASLIGAVKCRSLVSWVHGIGASMQTISSQLSLPAVSVEGAKAVMAAFQLGCLSIAIASLCYVLLAF